MNNFFSLLHLYKVFVYHSVFLTGLKFNCTTIDYLSPPDRSPIEFNVIRNKIAFQLLTVSPSLHCAGGCLLQGGCLLLGEGRCLLLGRGSTRGGWYPSMHWGRPPLLDTRYWKYYLAPNFVCGRQYTYISLYCDFSSGIVSSVSLTNKLSAAGDSGDTQLRGSWKYSATRGVLDGGYSWQSWSWHFTFRKSQLDDAH